jgi:PHD/YefM family antitoxin component YafN of YafNO toxin-antitoxin module
MEFKGTKGKWIVYPTDSVESHLDIAINSDKSDCVCWVYSKSDYKEINGKANALLISKAPEMLEMLKEIRNQMEDGRTYITKEDIQRLIKSATEI